MSLPVTTRRPADAPQAPPCEAHHVAGTTCGTDAPTNQGAINHPLIYDKHLSSMLASPRSSPPFLFLSSPCLPSSSFPSLSSHQPGNVCDMNSE